ncbi:MAG: allophanate hydrolase [Betaproteobacteria bacterium]|nr:allophanate hydrolase [Betaproteobacteria bacterium]
MIKSLDIATLSAAYAEGLSPVDVIGAVYQSIRAAGGNPIWIARTPEADALARARVLAVDPGARHLPLYGIPFAVKDNIDVEGLPTTAGCPAYAYEPQRSATAVLRLLAAGAICIGKTNLDQFATGLVGSRSPYGAVKNALNPAYISGGSSSGSAVAVALGQVSISLGTDTAGSGRIPAAFNNIVGLKPSCGRVSTAGVVPACRTLDCVSIFAGSCADAQTVLSVIEGPDALDPYSRGTPEYSCRDQAVIGIPRAEQLQWFGDRESPALFARALERLQRLGARIEAIDFAPFFEAGRLLYEGPWVAERYAAIGDFFRANEKDLLPVTRDIVAGAGRYSAADVFLAQYRLAEMKARIAPLWAAGDHGIDALCVPTAGTLYTAEMEKSEPLKFNSNLGLYANFVNLLDLAAIAVPAAMRSDGLPFGVSLVAPAGSDRWLCRLGAAFHASTGLAMGATAWMPSSGAQEVILSNVSRPATPQQSTPGQVRFAVVGAHLSGEPLNHQLTDRGARLLCSTHTAPSYQLFSLPDSTPPKPGLVRAGNGAGAAIELEIWELNEREFGSFVAAIPAPLGVATIELNDGSLVKGFICESHATQNAKDISSFGGWGAFIHPQS